MQCSENIKKELRTEELAKTSAMHGVTCCRYEDMHDACRGVVIATQAQAVACGPLQRYNVLDLQCELLSLFVFFMIGTIVQVLHCQCGVCDAAS